MRRLGLLSLGAVFGVMFATYLHAQVKATAPPVATVAPKPIVGQVAAPTLLGQLGQSCASGSACASGRCWPLPGPLGRCVPNDRTGKVNEFCNEDIQCASLYCWRDPSGNQCRLPQAEGQPCQSNAGCYSGRCDVGAGSTQTKKCIPKDGTGMGGTYCTANSQCACNSCLAGNTCATGQADLAVTDLTTDTGCGITAKIVNVGCGALASSLQSVDIQFWNVTAGSGIGGWPVDSLSLLRPPGGVKTFKIPSAYQVNGTITVKATIDSTNKVTEPNETNNAFSKSLTCTASLPDLTLSVTTTTACNNVIEIKNLGPGKLGTGAYEAYNLADTYAAGLERTIDGIKLPLVRLATLDPTKALVNPGGKVTWTEPSTARAYQSYSYNMKPIGQEVSTANNSVSATVASACTGTRPAYDVELTSLTLDNDCRTKVTVRNNGPGQMVPGAVAVQFLKAGAAVGGWGVEISQGLTSGASATGVGPYAKETTATPWRAYINLPAQSLDTNTANNQKDATLTCPK